MTVPEDEAQRVSEGDNPLGISREFASRLRRYRRDQPVRVAVVFAIAATRGAGERAGPRRARSEIARETRLAANAGLEEIDRVLVRYGGKRLVMSADALGSIAVETTAAGVVALATIPGVKAILEDQPITLVR